MKKYKTKFLLVLISGGRSSVKMARHIQKNKKYKRFQKLYVFCNTGMERPETIQFLKDMMQHWNIPLIILEGVYSDEPGVGVKSKVVDFDTMDMTGRVFSEAIRHMNKNKWHGVPNPATPYCSEYLKTRVSHDFAREYFGTTKYIKALGYRKEDMPKRITFAELREDETKIAPLLTDYGKPIELKDLDYYYSKTPFKLELPAGLDNCELCWKRSKNNLIKAIKYGTRFIDWHLNEEAIYGNMFFRENLSIKDLVELAEQDLGDKVNTKEYTLGDKCVYNF